MAQTTADADPIFSARPKDDPLQIFRFVQRTTGSAGMTPDDLIAHWLTSQQVAAELQISTSRLFQLRLAQQIPVTRIGKSTHLYNRADIEAFKETRNAAPNDAT